MKEKNLKLFIELYNLIDVIKENIEIIGINTWKREIQLTEESIKNIAKLLNISLEKQFLDFDNDSSYDIELSFVYEDIKFLAIK